MDNELQRLLRKLREQVRRMKELSDNIYMLEAGGVSVEEVRKSIGAISFEIEFCAGYLSDIIRIERNSNLL